MSDPENFLTRWSRRKHEEAADAALPGDETDLPRAPEPPPAGQSAGNVPPPPVAGGVPTTQPVFDLSTLPPIESITAETDIRAFLAPGVPAEMRLAALRRAWVADPKVRDFVGLNDYDFDFHTPGAIPGFGSLEMTDELRREVAEIITNWQSEPRRAEPRPAPVAVLEPEPVVSSAQPAVSAEEMGVVPPTDSEEREVERDQTAPPQGELIADQATTQRNKESAATQQQHSRLENLQTLAGRGHGGALPK
jgi:hypothetical protein